jgi:hypothetical protein
LAFLLAGAGVYGAMRVRVAIRMRRAMDALSNGQPRRCRATIRALARSSLRPPEDWITLTEALALFWEAGFERAMARADALIADGRQVGSPSRGVALKVLCLVFMGRPEEARRLFDAGRDSLRAHASSHTLGLGSDALEAILLFHEGAIAGSRSRLEVLLTLRRVRGAFVRIVHYYLAAIAHAEGRTQDARALLTAAIAGGGSLFIATWAADTHAELFPQAPIPLPRPRGGTTKPVPASGWRGLAYDLRLGLKVLFFRGKGEARAGYSHDHIALLLLANLGLVALLRSVHYSRAATFMPVYALAVAAPIALFAFMSTLVAAPLRVREGASRLAGAFYSATPGLLILEFVASRLDDHRHETAGSIVRLIAGVWSLAVVVLLARRLAPRAGILRLFATAALFAATWLAPTYWTAHLPVWMQPRRIDFDKEEKALAQEKALATFLYSQADAVHAAEAQLLPERPGIEDLYFVGFAGWGSQDVFLNELTFAQRLFDDRFDTRGRSIALANDLAARDRLPMATRWNLAHVLKAVGSRMNREEDVLFLFLTSHGSQAGLALEAPGHSLVFIEGALAPSELRAALDDAGIKWRVLMVSACESGVFVEPLRDDFTLIATAAASDRRSFGCANGNAFTEFGRAVFGEQLVRERSFATAFENAIAVIAQREAERNLEPSLPQLFVGQAVSAKLRAIEDRLDELAAP